MNKSELRKIYLNKQRNLSPEMRKSRSENISARLFEFFDFSEIRFLHCFLPIAKFNEVDTEIILQKVRQEFPHVQTLAPRVNFATNEIENLIFTSETEFSPNVWQISEPAHNEIVETEKIDLVLVPLLCFDARGYRVGYGKGFYDRLLRNCRADCLKIGLSFFPPVEKIEDTREFDVPLDYCVTPDRVFKMN